MDEAVKPDHNAFDNRLGLQTPAKFAVLVLIVGLLVALLLWAEHRAGASSEVQQIVSAEFTLADAGGSSPPPDTRWESVHLPDNWSRHRRDAEGFGWYRLSFRSDSSNRHDLALMVKRVSMSAEFYLNGHLLNPPMSVGEPIRRQWNTPQYRALPADWVVPGTNYIDVRIFAYRDYNGGLGKVAVGADPVIHSMFRQAHFLHSTISAAAAIVLLVMGLMAVAIGLRLGTYGSPLFLGLSCLLWTGRLLNDFVESVPLSWFWWGWPTHSLGGWVSVFMLLYCHRYMLVQRPRLEQFMLAYTALCTLLVGAYLGNLISKDALAVIWLPFNIGINVYMLLVLWQLLRQSRSVAPFLLAVSLAFFIVSDLHDRLIVTSSIERLVGFDSMYWRSISALLLSFAFCLLVADQLVLALQEARALNRDLEFRVEQKSNELQSNFERLDEARRRQGLLEERNRIMRDLHDGVGGDLVSAIKMLESGQMVPAQAAQLIAQCLDNLRLVFDSSGEYGDDLVAMLGNLRYRIAPRLSAARIRLQLDLDGVTRLACRPEVTLQIMRIVQEAITNALKHAQANELRIALLDHATKLVISDNGHGFQLDDIIAGRGTQNQQYRARSVGAMVHIESNASGTRVVIDLPANMQMV